MSVSPRLVVNLNAITENYNILKGRHRAGRCAAVVKANAYGLGVIPVAKQLHKEGCREFFVATLDEAIELRKGLMPDRPYIYIFNGIMSIDELEDMKYYGLVPVINSIKQLEMLKNAEIDTAIHIDTGMTRLGLSIDELRKTIAERGNNSSKNFINKFRIKLVMSHLACAGDAEHVMNNRQLEVFEQVREIFANIEGISFSLANSAGHFLDERFHYDIGRPGCSLYGITPYASYDMENPMQQVANLEAPIIQIRNIDKEEYIGYGAEAKLHRGMRVATIALGYADGLMRCLGGASSKISAFIGDFEAPMIGRVSMDMTCYDISNVPDYIVEREPFVRIIDSNQTVDKVAEICNTIGYEIFTSIGNRVKRVYVSHFS